jgi:uncharacterized membrane protein
MLAVSASRICKRLSLLMVCLLVVAVVVCLVHTDDIDRSQTAHQGHHHTSASSATHLTLDLHCLVAILPGIVALLWFCLARLYLAMHALHAGGSGVSSVHSSQSSRTSIGLQ